MRAVRFLSLALLLVAGLSATAHAQSYDNTPGTYYDVKVGIVPAALPPGSLPAGLPSLGPDLYVGVLTIDYSGGIYYVQYKGERSDRAKLNVIATFNSDWVGVKLGSLVVGSSLESNVITGIDGMHLISANINGVGTVDGSVQRVIAKFDGTGFYPPELRLFKVNPAPGNLR
jgi:hypothetical protein